MTFQLNMLRAIVLVLLLGSVASAYMSGKMRALVERQTALIVQQNEAIKKQANTLRVQDEALRKADAALKGASKAMDGMHGALVSCRKQPRSVVVEIKPCQGRENKDGQGGIPSHATR